MEAEAGGHGRAAPRADALWAGGGERLLQGPHSGRAPARGQLLTGHAGC